MLSQTKSKNVFSDNILITVLIILVGTGLSMLLSSSYFHGDKIFGDSLYFFRRQVLWVVIGVLAGFFVANIKLDFLRWSVPLLVLLSFILMILTFVPGVGVEIMGARRWIIVGGMSFEPSELVKFSLILYLAHILDRKGNLSELSFSQNLRAILPPLIIVSVFTGLVYLQNDFSTAFFLVLLSMSMMWFSGVRLSFFISLVSVGIPLSVLLLLTKEHRVLRLIAFLEPNADPVGSGYQVLSAKTALARGGLWGQGIGQGKIKLGSLPEAHSDFVFAVLGEEMGLLGVVLIIGLFLVFAWRGYRIVYWHPEQFGKYLSFGITTSIIFQAFLNIAVVSGLLPTTGLPLPLFSQGGSSMLITLMMCGLLVGLSKKKVIEATNTGTDFRHQFDSAVLEEGDRE